MTTESSGGLRHEDDDDKFLILPRPTVRDDKLSFRARGLLAFICDLPKGWDVNAGFLVKQGKEGREAVYSALSELRTRGYYRVEKRRAEGGRWVTGTAVSKTARPAWAAEYAEQEAARKAKREEPVPVYEPPVVTDSEALDTPSDLRVSVHREPDVREADARNAVGLKEERGRSSDKETPLPTGGAPAEIADQLALVEEPEPAARKSRRKTGIPADWQPSPELSEWTSQTAPGMPRSEIEAFRDFHIARGNTFAEHDRAWRTWVRRWLKYDAPRLRRNQPYRDPQRAQQEQIGTTDGPPASDGWDDYIAGGQDR